MEAKYQKKKLENRLNKLLEHQIEIETETNMKFKMLHDMVSEVSDKIVHLDS